MKFFKYIVLFFCSIIYIIGCSQTVKIDTDSDSVEVTEHKALTSNTPKDVRIIFNLRSQFPSGAVNPDRVTMDGKVIYENTFIKTGYHVFEIEKRGYKKKKEKILVEDSDGDGIFYLSLELEPKERVIIFDIRDKDTNKPIVPDQVVMISLPNEKRQSISDKALVKPGIKEVVVQKEGYKPVSKSITIETKEEPYILSLKMEKEKSSE